MKKIVFLLLIFSSFLFSTTIEKGFEYFKKGNYIAAADILIDKLDNNFNQIERFLNTSCKNNNYYGCTGLAVVYAKKNKIKAFNLANKACKHNNYYGCAILSLFYKDGVEVNKNEKKYFQLFEKALILAEKECQKGNIDACVAIGMAYSGNEKFRNPNKAIKFYEKACKNGDENICILLGLGYENKLTHIRRIIKRLFEDENKFYSHLAENIKNLINSPNYKKSINFYNLACKNGKAIACYQIGELYHLKLHNNKEAIKYFKKSIEIRKKECKKGKGGACYKVAGTYELNLHNKEKADKFYKKAIEIFNKECKNNNAEKCAVLGVMYEEGKGVKINQKKAKYYFNKVCKIDKNSNLCKDVQMYVFERLLFGK